MFENFDWMEAMRQSPVMVVILLCSIATLALAIERMAYFGKRRGKPDAILSAAMTKLRAGDLQAATRLCHDSPHPVGPVAATVLQNWNLDPDSLDEKLAIAISEQRLALERNLGFLGTMGNTAPLIGLLGTVWGIMRAFHDMAVSGAAGPSVVAAGVAEALLTTAASLVVAVPAVLLFNHFTRRITVMLTVAENHARTVRLAIEQARKAPQQGAPARGREGEPVHAR